MKSELIRLRQDLLKLKSCRVTVEAGCVFNLHAYFRPTSFRLAWAFFCHVFSCLVTDIGARLRHLDHWISSLLCTYAFRVPRLAKPGDKLTWHQHFSLFISPSHSHTHTAVTPSIHLQLCQLKRLKRKCDALETSLRYILHSSRLHYSATRMRSRRTTSP